VQLPPDMHANFAALCDHNGVTAATLLYGWYVAAARAVQQGRGHAFPRGGKYPRGSIGAPLMQVHWSQGGEEYRRCRDRLAAAGTDPTVVLRAAVAAYIAAKGDILSMAWPPDVAK